MTSDGINSFLFRLSCQEGFYFVLNPDAIWQRRKFRTIRRIVSKIEQTRYPDFSINNVTTLPREGDLLCRMSRSKSFSRIMMELVIENIAKPSEHVSRVIATWRLPVRETATECWIMSLDQNDYPHLFRARWYKSLGRHNILSSKSFGAITLWPGAHKGHSYY